MSHFALIAPSGRIVTALPIDKVAPRRKRAARARAFAELQRLRIMWNKPSYKIERVKK